MTPVVGTNSQTLLVDVASDGTLVYVSHYGGQLNLNTFDPVADRSTRLTMPNLPVESRVDLLGPDKRRALGIQTCRATEVPIVYDTETGERNELDIAERVVPMGFRDTMSQQEALSALESIDFLHPVTIR
ncbi:MAG: hypothetical protein J07HB67_00225 [halophilic archaeon J07HB67]|nr:MAG: hypothetical protein J07HB67_00225 [halophilic archaeon J07HB67]